TLAGERRSLLDGLREGARAAVHLGASAFRMGREALADAFPVEAAIGRGVQQWLKQRQNCDSHAPPADGEGGSSHRVMVVAGIESAMTNPAPPLALPVAALGYQPGEVTYFSYAGGGDYGKSDTEGPLMAAAHRLAQQLRAMQRAQPGREVDLIAHS